MARNAADLDRELPVLQGLARADRRRVPFVQQLAAAECGAACLAMVLGYYDKEVALDDIRTLMGTGRDGATALAILDAAAHYGLRGRGVKIELEELALLPRGAILHWEFNHFVVFERVRGKVIEVVDPALGRRRVSLEQLGRSFTGIALLLEPSDTFDRSAPAPRALWRQLVAVVAESGQWSRILTMSLLLQLFALALPALTGAIVDRVIPRGDTSLLSVLAAGLGGLVGFYFVASMVRAHLLIRLRTLFDARMTLGFLDHLLRLPYAFFLRRSAGDLMMRVNSNAAVREILTSGVLSAVLDGALAILYLAIIAVASPPFALIVATLALAQLAVFWFSRDRQHELMAEALHKQARTESFLTEMLTGIETLKATGTELRAGERWSGLFVDQLNVAIERARMGALVDSLGGTLRLASPLVVLGYGALQVLDGRLTLGTALALCALSGAFLGPLANLVASATQLQLLRSYLERIGDVLGAEPEQPADAPGLVAALAGRVTLENVTFRYAPAAPLVVRDVSVDIAPGAFVAIVGRSGSGKSTLASLLVGLHRAERGRILYDGQDLAALDVRALRQQIGIVTQRAYLFGASVRSNIAMADPELPLSAVVAAARLAQLDDEIRAMPMGYETILLDGGASLSGGQRQRLALARALVRRPAILLLDEATSALDAVTERAVQRALGELACTRIVIAHRLSTIREADLILVMEDGQVVEHGRHAALVLRGGVYATLVAAQLENAVGA